MMSTQTAPECFPRLSEIAMTIGVTSATAIFFSSEDENVPQVYNDTRSSHKLGTSVHREEGIGPVVVVIRKTLKFKNCFALSLIKLLINLIKPRLIMNINEPGDRKFLQPPMPPLPKPIYDTNTCNCVCRE